MLAAFFLEVGFALIVVPWSAFWDRNYFVQALPMVGKVMTNNFVRGAVSGLGVINMAVGTWEILAMLLARNAAPPSSPLRTVPKD